MLGTMREINDILLHEWYPLNQYSSEISKTHSIFPTKTFWDVDHHNDLSQITNENRRYDELSDSETFNCNMGAYESSAIKTHQINNLTEKGRLIPRIIQICSSNCYKCTNCSLENDRAVNKLKQLSLPVYLGRAFGNSGLAF